MMNMLSSSGIQGPLESGLGRIDYLWIVEIGWDGDNGIWNIFTKICFSGLFHFVENHWRNFFWEKCFVFTLVFNLDFWFTAIVDNIEREMLHIWLDGRVFEFSANETLGIENSVWWVHGDLVLGSVTNQTFRVSESNIGRSSTVTLKKVFRDDYLEVSLVCSWMWIIIRLSLSQENWVGYHQKKNQITLKAWLSSLWYPMWAYVISFLLTWSLAMISTFPCWKMPTHE